VWVPVHKTWQLNERHYGALQGRGKAEVAAEVGEDRVFAWRRSFDLRPPPLDPEDPRHPRHDPRYRHIDPALLPAAESLQDTAARVLPYWQKDIEPDLREGKHVLISGHGNSLRALIQHLDRISPVDVAQLEIPTGIPLVYQVDDKLRPTMEYYNLATGKEIPVPGPH
jgi:2,3-bisphosphoglycerate-dependent phosphoglycerate mutase